MTPELMTYAIAGLAFVAIAGLGMVFAGGNGRGKQSKAPYRLDLRQPERPTLPQE